MVATALSVGGLFTAFTYTAVFLTDVSRFAPGAIGLLLLIRGLADFAGITAGGIARDRHQRVAMVTPVLLLAVALLGMFLLAGSPVATGVLLAPSGFAMGALTPALQNRVLEVAPGSADLAAAGNSAAFNVGIAGVSLLGAVVLSRFGVRGTASWRVAWWPWRRWSSCWPKPLFAGGGGSRRTAAGVGPAHADGAERLVGQ